MSWLEREADKVRQDWKRKDIRQMFYANGMLCALAFLLWVLAMSVPT